MATPTPVTPTLVARVPVDISLPNTINLPTSLINSVLSQIPTELGTYELPSSVPGITIHYTADSSTAAAESSQTATPESSPSSESSTSATPSPSSEPASHHSSNTSVLAGVFTAVALLALLLILALVWFTRRRRRRQKLDRDMAEAAIVPRGTVSRSRFPHLRGGDRASDRTRSLLSPRTSFFDPVSPNAAEFTPAAEDFVGVGTYAGRRSGDARERPAIKSPTYTEIMAPAQATLPTSESGYTPYVPPVHYEGYFPPVFDAPDTRYAALGARDPFADALTPTTDDAPSSSEDAGGGAYARRAGPGPPLAYPELAAAPAGAAGLRSHRGSVGSAYAHDAASAESALVFAPAGGYRPAHRMSSHTGYGDWLAGGLPVAGAGSSGSTSDWSGSGSGSSSEAGAAQAGRGAVPFTASANASHSGGALATIPESVRRHSPPSGPETPNELSDDGDYRVARRLTVANQ